MDDGDNRGLRPAVQGRFELCGFEDLAPGAIDAMQGATDPADDVAHAVPEDSVDGHQNLVARLDKVDEGRLHAGATGARNGNSQLILGAEDLTQALLRLCHQFEELRIQVTHERATERLVDSGVHHGRAWAEQRSLWR